MNGCQTASTAMTGRKGKYTEGTAECANDCKLIIEERTYYYHSECGTFNDKENNQNLSVTAKEKESINVILAQYVTLGSE